MNTSFPLFAIATAIFLSSFIPVQAVVLEGPFSYNGHTYYILDEKSWTASQAEAVTMGGNLVTVNDLAEWTFLVERFFNTNYDSGPGSDIWNIWIGLHDPDNDGVYTWVSGDPSTYQLNTGNLSPSGRFGTVLNEAGWDIPFPGQPGIDWALQGRGLPFWVTHGDELKYGIVEVVPPPAPGIGISVGGTGIASGGSVSFGSVNQGQNTAITLTLSNPGAGGLQDIVASITPPGSADFSLVSAPPASLAAGASANFVVRFTPQATGSRQATLSVASNADATSYQILLNGVGAVAGPDTIPPVIIVPATDFPVDCDAPDKVALVNAWLAAHGGASATDDSSGVTWTHNFTSLPSVCSSAAITFTASDATGNTAVTSATLSVQDITPPAITTVASPSTVESDGAWNTAALNAWINSHGGATATDTCSSVSWSHNFTGLPNNLPQTVPVIFTANDACGNSVTTSSTFTIQDTTPPTITVAATDGHGRCATGAADIAGFLSNHGGAQAVDIAGPLTWTHNYSGTLPPCESYIVVNFTATDGVGLTASTSARFHLFPPGSIWIGAAADSWSTATGWLDQIPDATLDAYVDLFDFQDTVLTLAGDSAAKNLYIGEGDELRIDGSRTLSVFGGTIQNDGRITIDDRSSNVATLEINANTLLSGTGTLYFDSGDDNWITSTSPAHVLTVGADQTLLTSPDALAGDSRSRIIAGLRNEGHITASQGGLQLDTNPKVNTSTIEAINGGTIVLRNVSLDNTGGFLVAGAGSSFGLDDATVTGGILQGPGEFSITQSNSATLAGPLGIAPDATVFVNGGDKLFLTDTVTNDGTLRILDIGGGVADLEIVGNAALLGSGQIVLDGNDDSRITSAAPGDVLTIGPAQEIITTDVTQLDNARIIAAFTNDGTITANEGDLQIDTNPKTNNSLIQAIGGGEILFEDVTVENANGTIRADSGSSVELDNATINGGLLDGGGRFDVIRNGDATLNGPLAIGTGTIVSVNTSDVLNLSGTITNDGSLEITDEAGGLAYLRIIGDVTLSGSGQVLFLGGDDDVFDSANQADTLTIGPDQEVTTSPAAQAGSSRTSFRVRTINNGTVSADIGGLRLDTNPKTNNGTFRASGGGTLELIAANTLLTNYDATTDTLTGGRWEVIAEGTTTTMDMVSAPIVTLAAGTHVRLSGANASFPQLSGLANIAGSLSLEKGKMLDTAGDLTVSGRLQFGLENGAVLGFDNQRLLINGNVNFTGSTIDVSSFGTTPGLYEVVRWTGNASGVPTLGNIPPGLSYSLIYDTSGKTLYVSVDAVPGGFKILSVMHELETGTTTIDYLSEAGISHTVRGTEDFVSYDDLPATVVGTGAVLQYVHVAEEPSERYFYQFSTVP